ncbi:TraR/DksA family transcriptional regulator [Streptomyces sp. NPDC057386]|uniref:TraR/DksA family transcriptional regulator n=1 Tax=unclassified Streptomyces TaxID=2593676 RepID=UPI00363A5572
MNHLTADVDDLTAGTDGRTVGVDGRTAGVGGRTVGVSDRTVGTDGRTAGVDGRTVGVGGRTAGVGGRTVGVDDLTVGTDGRTVGMSDRTPAAGRRAPVRPAAAHLSAEDLAALRENLNEQRAFRREQLRRLAGPVTSRDEDLLRQRTAGQIEVHIRLVALARMVLSDVEDALRRMDDGFYGSCLLCRRPIDRERLSIVPQARYCARCRQAEEARP